MVVKMGKESTLKYTGTVLFPASALFRHEGRAKTTWQQNGSISFFRYRVPQLLLNFLASFSILSIELFKNIKHEVYLYSYIQNFAFIVFGFLFAGKGVYK